MNLTEMLEGLRAERARLDQAIAALEDLEARTDPPARRSGPNERPAAGKGRGQKKSKLAAHEDVIRGMYERAVPPIKIAQKFKCTPEAIRLLAKKRNWVRRPTALAKGNGEVKITKLPRGASRQEEI